MNYSDRPWIVLKFGGTSVSSSQNWHNIQTIIQNHQSCGYRPLLVCSALATISNLLDTVFTQVSNGRNFEVGLTQIVQVHLSLCSDLEMLPPQALKERLSQLEQDLTTLQRQGALQPEDKAHIMSYGELMSTVLGQHWLTKQGLNLVWQDARQLLTAQNDESHAPRHFLTAYCDHEFDARLGSQLAQEAPEGLITQGFIASDHDGKTVLLGRGGSDTSAALLAAKIGARELEIWTDVPGMYTANPRLIKSARLIEALDYDEAEIMAYRGAKVLHPRSLAPVRSYNIPLRIRCTSAPWHPGTKITRQKQTLGQGRVRAISSRSSLCMVSARREDHSLEALDFMTRVTDAFRSHGIGIQNLTSSNEQVSATLESNMEAVVQTNLENMLEELKEFSSPHMHLQVGSVSLIGNGIASALQDIGPALEPLPENHLHQMIHGSDNRDITLLMAHENTEPMVNHLHKALIEEASQEYLGDTWSEFTVQKELKERELVSGLKQ